MLEKLTDNDQEIAALVLRSLRDCDDPEEVVTLIVKAWIEHQEMILQVGIEFGSSGFFRKATDVPESGKALKCMICARDKPWGVFDTTTGAAVCVECRDNARAPLQAELKDLLCCVAQLLDGWHQDGTAWSEWDESVRKRVAAMQQRLGLA